MFENIVLTYFIVLDQITHFVIMDHQVNIQEINNLSREQFCLLIKQLYTENECLKKDLIKYKFLLKSYENVFNEIKETFASDKKVLNLLKDIKMFNNLDNKKCFVSLKKLSDNYLNENNGQRVEESVERNDITEERPDRQPEEEEIIINHNIKQEVSEENCDQKPIKIKIKIEGIKQEVKEENQIKLENNNSLTTLSIIKTEPISDETEDTDIEFIEVIEKDTNFAEIIDISDEESKDYENQPKSDKTLNYNERSELSSSELGQIEGIFWCPLQFCNNLFKTELNLREHLINDHKIVENSSVGRQTPHILSDNKWEPFLMTEIFEISDNLDKESKHIEFQS